MAALLGPSYSRIYVPGKQWTPPPTPQLVPGVFAHYRSEPNGMIHYFVNDAAERDYAFVEKAAAAALAAWLVEHRREIVDGVKTIGPLLPFLFP